MVEEIDDGKDKLRKERTEVGCVYMETGSPKVHIIFRYSRSLKINIISNRKSTVFWKTSIYLKRNFCLVFY